MEHKDLERLNALLRGADAVVIAASNGFDIADGYNQFACDAEFLRAFGDFNRTYGLTSVLQGLMSRWPTDEARWAFLARLISYGLLSYEPSPAMRALDELTAGIPRFVVTCNCNGRFERAGFSPDALLETEGSYAYLRCSAACSDELYDAAPAVAALAQDAPVPRCPRCGAALDVVVDDRGGLARYPRFRAQAQRFNEFLATHAEKNMLILELGMGQRNPAIKAPLMRWAAAAPNVSYVVVNREPAVLPALPPERTLGLTGDVAEVLLALLEVSK